MKLEQKQRGEKVVKAILGYDIMPGISVDEYERFAGGTTPQDDPAEFSAVFSADNGVTLGSGRREFYAQFAGASYEEVGKPVSVGDVVVASYKGNATGLGTNKCFYVDNLSDTAF